MTLLKQDTKDFSYKSITMMTETDETLFIDTNAFVTAVRYKNDEYPYHIDRQHPYDKYFENYCRRCAMFYTIIDLVMEHADTMKNPKHNSLRNTMKQNLVQFIEEAVDQIHNIQNSNYTPDGLCECDDYGSDKVENYYGVYGTAKMYEEIEQEMFERYGPGFFEDYEYKLKKSRPTNLENVIDRSNYVIESCGQSSLELRRSGFDINDPRNIWIVCTPEYEYKWTRTPHVSRYLFESEMKNRHRARKHCIDTLIEQMRECLRMLITYDIPFMEKAMDVIVKQTNMDCSKMVIGFLDDIKILDC